MVTVGNGGKMEQYMKGNLNKTRNMVKVNLIGLTEVAMMVNFSKIIFMDKVNLNGAMVESIRAISKMN